MTLPCGYDNDAVCELRHGVPLWTKAPDHVHLSRLLVDDPAAGPVVLQVYRVVGSCPWEAGLLHGDHVRLTLAPDEIVDVEVVE